MHRSLHFHFLSCTRHIVVCPFCMWQLTNLCLSTLHHAGIRLKALYFPFAMKSFWAVDLASCIKYFLGCSFPVFYWVDCGQSISCPAMHRLWVVHVWSCNEQIFSCPCLVLQWTYFSVHFNEQISICPFLLRLMCCGFSIFCLTMNILLAVHFTSLKERIMHCLIYVL